MVLTLLFINNLLINVICANGKTFRLMLAEGAEGMVWGLFFHDNQKKKRIFAY